MQQATPAYEEAVDAVQAAEGVLEDATQELDTWKNGKLLAVEDFKQHGMGVVQPAFDYFDAKFWKEGGAYYNIMQAYRGAMLFNPMEAARMTT